MIQGGVVENMHHGMHCPGLEVFCAINQVPDARMDHSTRAHGAGLNGHKKIAASQAMIAEGRSGFPQRHDFCVSCRIGIGEIAIESAADYFALMYYDGADWHFSQVESALSGPQGFVHPQFVGFGTSAVSHEQYCMRMVGLEPQLLRK
jgi:hypothetical protein